VFPQHVELERGDGHRFVDVGFTEERCGHVI